MGMLLALLYAPLLMWLGHVGAHVRQLSAGGLLVLFALLLCVRDARETLRLEPQVTVRGLGLLGLALLALGAARWLKAWALPLALVSFALAFAAVVSFLVGDQGARRFLPALGAIVVFGLLAGLFPALDWPLRALAGQYAAGVLGWLGVPVRLGIHGGAAPELLLQAADRTFIVATECNGFGLLTSSLVLAVVLALQARWRWTELLGLALLAGLGAIVCNFLRIVSICLLASRVPVSYAVLHEVLGNLFYLGGLTLVWFWAGRPRSFLKSPAASPTLTGS